SERYVSDISSTIPLTTFLRFLVDRLEENQRSSTGSLERRAVLLEVVKEPLRSLIARRIDAGVTEDLLGEARAVDSFLAGARPLGHKLLRLSFTKLGN